MILYITLEIVVFRIIIGIVIGIIGILIYKLIKLRD